MTRFKQAKLTPGKSNTSLWIDSIVLCVLLGFIVLRATIIENPLINQLQSQHVLGFEGASLLMSSFLLVCMALWFLLSVFSNRFVWRRTGFGIAVGVFIIAGIISAFVASDKRASVTNFVTLATPMLAGVILVQLLNSSIRIRLALLLILSVGIAATTLCYMQSSSLNDDMIKNFEENPAQTLANLGIEPGSLQQWMYEHRLYSKDIRGFLMTSNSAASFFLLAVFAAIGLCVQAICECMKYKTWKEREHAMVVLICYLVGFCFVFAGLLLTQSKGGGGAFIIGLLTFIVLSVFGKAIWKHRRVAGILILLLLVTATGVIIHYGMKHGRLPGGNSMLVRWQYWVSTASMVRDHFITGVGGGNFSEYYTHYKDPAALETVQNPHNWLLSVLSQYGPLGLVALLAAFLIPIYKACGRCFEKDQLSVGQSPQDQSKIWIGMLAFSVILMLATRPLWVGMDFLFQGDSAVTIVAAYTVLYAVPAGILLISFILLKTVSRGDKTVEGPDVQLSIALVCGLIAVLVHNLIDFAIFEPGVWSILWLFIAILVARQFNRSPNESERQIQFDRPQRFGLVAGIVLVGIIYLNAVLLPPLKAEILFRRSTSSKVDPVALVEAAIAADSLSSGTAYQSAFMLKKIHEQQTVNNEHLLEKGHNWAHIAAMRNPAGFKPWRLLAELEILLSEQTEGEEKKDHLKTAFDYLQNAIARYPGSGRLHYDLARIAGQLNRNDAALCHYTMAVEIEDAYRDQFKVMYPESQTIVSRLGQARYLQAKTKIETLRQD